MTHDLALAILAVVMAFGSLGTWYLITKDTDVFTKSVFGWLFAASWTLAVIMPATKSASSMSHFAVMSLFTLVAVAPAFLFGFLMERREKKKLRWC